MATITERFGFTKPAGSDPASIVPLNSNTDLIEQYLGRTQDMIAPMYDDTATYDVGDIVTYESNLYKCITAITTPETFDDTKWEATTAVEEGSGGGGGSSVIPNPTGTPTDTLSTIGIDGTIYGIEGSGGGGGDGYTEIVLFEESESTYAGIKELSDNISNYDELIFRSIYENSQTTYEQRVSTSLIEEIGYIQNPTSSSNHISLEFGYDQSFYRMVRGENDNELNIFQVSGTRHVVTIIGVKYEGSGGGGSSEAEDINYDNTTSHLTSNNVQEAIDEVVANANTASEDILTLQNVQGYDEYDETQTYAVGDYAIYNNIVYECTTAVSTAEPFDSTKWTATSIEQIIDGVKGDISQLNSSLTKYYIAIADVNCTNTASNSWGFWGYTTIDLSQLLANKTLISIIPQLCILKGDPAVIGLMSFTYNASNHQLIPRVNFKNSGTFSVQFEIKYK